jgi:hypothetical protein
VFLPAVLTAQQYHQTNLVSDTQMEGTHAFDPDLKNPWGTGATIAQVEKRRFLYVADLETAKIPISSRFEGKLEDQNSAVISINGLWAWAPLAGTQAV